MRALPLILLTIRILAAQQAELSIKVDVNLVNAAFIVRDRSGALARDIAKDEIEVFEDGVRQDVRFFSRSDDLPLRLALVADVSGSQREFARAHRRDIQEFVGRSIGPRDRAMLICFGNRIRVVSDFTPSAAELMSAFELFDHSEGKKKKKGEPGVEFAQLDSDGSRTQGTALFDAVHAAAEGKLLPIPGERKAIILFSDGKDNASAYDLMDAIEAAQSADSVIYTVRYVEQKNGHDHLPARNRYGVREMNRLAEETGGASFDAAKQSVGESLRQVTEELRSMYEIGYHTTNPERDGRFRKVVIRAKREGLMVRAKPGYYAR